MTLLCPHFETLGTVNRHEIPCICCRFVAPLVVCAFSYPCSYQVNRSDHGAMQPLRRSDIKKKKKGKMTSRQTLVVPFFCFDLRSACHNGQSRRRERRQGGIGSMIMEREGSQFERACFSADAAGYFAGSKYHPRSATPHEGDSTTAGPEVSDGRAHPPNAALCKVPGTAL